MILLKFILFLIILIWAAGSFYVGFRTFKEKDVMLISKIVVTLFWPVFTYKDLIEDWKQRYETKTHNNAEQDGTN